MDKEGIEHAISLLLIAIGEDVSRDGLVDTPKRVANFYADVLNGYDEDIEKHIKLFDCSNDDMVVIKQIPIYSFCEHHLCPMAGKASIAYIPNGKVIGLSKLTRIARIFAKRLQIQERLVEQIAVAIDMSVPNKGVAVRLELEHSCMTIRGVRTVGASAVSTHLTGMFKENAMTRNEFIEVIK